MKVEIDDRDWIECYLLDVTRGLPRAHLMPNRGWHSIKLNRKPAHLQKKRGRKFSGGRKRPSAESRRTGRPIGRPRSNPKNAAKWAAYARSRSKISINQGGENEMSKESMIGRAVIFVDSIGRERPAIVTNEFGAWGEQNKPSINVAVVHADEDRSDQYGRQIERFTSVVHQSNQQAHGMYWKESY